MYGIQVAEWLQLGCQEDSLGERRRLPRVGPAEDGGTGDKMGGNLRSRAEKWVERAQEETEGKEGCTEEEGAGGREEGCAGATPL